MGIITVDGKWLIRVDSKNYTVCKKTGTEKENGELQYKVCGYFGTLSQACKGLIKYMAREELKRGTFSLEEAVTILDKAHTRVCEFINNTALRYESGLDEEIEDKISIIEDGIGEAEENDE